MDVRRKSMQLAMEKGVDERFFAMPAAQVHGQRGSVSSGQGAHQAYALGAAPVVHAPSSNTLSAVGNRVSETEAIGSTNATNATATNATIGNVISATSSLSSSSHQDALSPNMFDSGPSFVSVPARAASHSSASLGSYPGVSPEYSQPPHTSGQLSYLDVVEHQGDGDGGGVVPVAEWTVDFDPQVFLAEENEGLDNLGNESIV